MNIYNLIINAKKHFLSSHVINFTNLRLFSLSCNSFSCVYQMLKLLLSFLFFSNKKLQFKSLLGKNTINSICNQVAIPLFQFHVYVHGNENFMGMKERNLLLRNYFLLTLRFTFLRLLL